MSVSLPIDVRYELTHDLAKTIYWRRLRQARALLVVMAIMNISTGLLLYVGREGEAAFFRGVLLGFVLGIDLLVYRAFANSYGAILKNADTLSHMSPVMRIDKDSISFLLDGSSSSYLWKHVTGIQRYPEFWFMKTLFRPNESMHVPANLLSEDAQRYIEAMVESNGGKVV